MADLTAIILTKNEEKNIAKCINSLTNVTKRVVVVDSYSDDTTIEIARMLNADVYQHPFENHAAQFNWAIENTGIETEWVMKIDADEELTQELAVEIQEELDRLPQSTNGIILRRRVYFMGRWMRHGGKYPELLLRIIRFGHGMSEMKKMDEHLIITDGDTHTFKNDFIDFNNNSLEHWITKHNWYSNKEVLEQQSKQQEDGFGKSQSKQARIKRFIKNHGYYSLPKFFRAHLYYIYRYYIRLGILDGKEGKIFTFLQAYWYRYLVDAKMFECEKFDTMMKEQADLKR